MEKERRAIQKAAAVPIEVDDPDLLNVEARQSNEASPMKRTRWDEGAPRQGSVSRTSLPQLSPLTTGMGEVKNRVSVIENQIATKVDQTLNMVQTLSDTKGARPQASARTRRPGCPEGQGSQARSHHPRPVEETGRFGGEPGGWQNMAARGL